MHLQLQPRARHAIGATADPAPRRAWPSLVRAVRWGRAATAATLCVAAPFAWGPAAAQASDGWRFTGSLNLYLPTFHGSSSFPPTGGGSAATVDIGGIFDHLEGTFMGSLEARKGPVGVFTDLLYLDLSGNKSGSRSISIGSVALPAGAQANIDLGLRGTVWAIGGSYRLSQAPAQTLDAFAGARMLDLRSSASWSLSGNVGTIGLQDRSAMRESRSRNWDAIVGLKGRYVGSDGKWFLPYYLDVGGGDSQLTYQAIAGVGRAFSWGDVAGTWRYMDYKFKDGAPLQDLDASGPMISAIFHW